MRTSRVSKDTSNALSSLPTRSRPTRSAQARSLRVFSYNATGSTPGAAPPTADSDLSPVPSDPKNDLEPVDIASATARKRKRGPPVPSPGTAPLNSSEQTASSSPSPARKREAAASPSQDATTAKPQAKRARRQPAKKLAKRGDVKVEPPLHWEEVYNLTKEMRSKIVAPVDTMGCERLADTTASPQDQRFQTLIALMLSSQTKDTVTAAAMKNLQENLPGGLTLASVLSTTSQTLNSLISKVGFHNTKTSSILRTAQLLRDEHSSDIPSTVAGLTSLPGVGPKMAHLCMSAAWGRTEGIGVDVHVHRITNLWGWHKTKAPEETRKALESWLPRDKWHEINGLLVGFGQMLCTPVGRRCGECVLAERGLCPGAVVGRRKVVQRRIKKEEGAGSGDENVDGEAAVVVKEENIKAEDVDDIEDFGIMPRRSRRGRA